MRTGKEIKANHYNQQPHWFNAINNVWRASYPLGTKSNLDKDSLIKAARKATGLHDLGNLFWDEPLERMLTSINEEAQLHPIGQFITRQRLINLLVGKIKS